MTARTTTASWGTTGQFPLSVTDPTGAQTQMNYNWSFGLPSSKTDPNGLVTSWLYGDGFGRETQETWPDGTYTTLTYSDMTGAGYNFHGLAVGHYTYTSGATLLRIDDFGYDPVDRLVVQVNENLSGGYNQFNVTYDSLGRMASRSAPCAWVAWPTVCTYWTTTNYDVLNRPIKVQRPISASDSTLQTATIVYAGRTSTITDPLSNATTLVTDVNGWHRRTADALGYAVTTGYDAAGSRTSVTDSGGNTLWSGGYAYGLKAFLIASTDADRGSWSYTNDALGERASWTDAKGQNFSATYDALSRPLTRTEPDLYTAWTWGSSATSHNVGSLQRVCTGTGTSPTNCTASPGYSESETYDSIARLSQRSITLPGAGTFSYQYVYNSTTGLLSTLTYPTSTSGYALQLQYGYSNGILQSVTDISDSPNVTVWTAISANPAGQITQETLGNGVVTDRAWDAVTGWLGSVTSGVGSGAGIQNQSFLYDEMGNVTQRQDNNLGLTENAYYDNDYRLSYTKLNGTENLSLGYAPNGNITSRSDVASGATWTYSATQIHAVTQAGSSAYTYGYDANGNATSRQGSAIAWASYNYPTSISAGSGSTAENVAFDYGPDRQRWLQSYTGNGTTESTYYVGSLFEVVTSGGSTNYRHYVRAGSEPVAVYSRTTSGTNTWDYIQSDHEGSVAAITSSSGSPVVDESFTPFGNRRNPATWSGAASNSDLTTAAGITREGYTFQTQLGLWMGMNHMKGRVQDSLTGRFLSADPKIPDPINPQDYNRYSYVDNNPLSLTDPTGFDSNGPDVGPDGQDPATGQLQNVNVYGCYICTQPQISAQAAQSLISAQAAQDQMDLQNFNSWLQQQTAANERPPNYVQLPPARLSVAPSAANPSSNAAANNTSSAPQTTPETMCGRVPCLKPSDMPPPPPQPCPNGGSPSLVNNSNSGTRALNGAKVGAIGGMMFGGVAVANIIGFPEVEAGEGVAGVTVAIFGGASDVANGSLLGGTLFGGLGLTGGLMTTPSLCPGVQQ
jgi:RHS repeat-associated protein